MLIGTTGQYRECGLPSEGYICLQHRRFEGVLPFEPYQLKAGTGRPNRNANRGKPARPAQVRDNSQ